MEQKELRQQRFTSLISIGKSSNTVAVFAESPLVLKYKNEHKNVDIHKQAINGLISYGKKNNCQKQANQLSNLLQKAIQSKNYKAIGDCTIYLYTLQSFLYKSVNQYLRNAQFQNAGSTTIISSQYQAAYYLLPFCTLLNQHVRERTRTQFKGNVFRGCNLNQDQINEYIQNIGANRQWNGFTSTSKNRKKSQNFGNVLFVIKLGQHDSSWGLHYGLQIQKHSAFTSQEEVLLFAGMQILIQNVEKQNNKYVITIICTDMGP